MFLAYKRDLSTCRPARIDLRPSFTRTKDATHGPYPLPLRLDPAGARRHGGRGMIEITTNLAAHQEALVLRLEPLLRQVEAFGRRRPEAAAPAELVGLAAELLCAEHCLLRSDRAPLEQPVPKSFAGLAGALGQAQAPLAQFEAQHSVWGPWVQRPRLALQPRRQVAGAAAQAPTHLHQNLGGTAPPSTSARSWCAGSTRSSAPLRPGLWRRLGGQTPRRPNAGLRT